MKKTILVVIALLIFGLGCVAQQGQPQIQNNQTNVSSPPNGSVNTTPTTQQFSVEISGFAFNPDTITITKGSTVTWTNKDSAPHTISGSGFESGSLSTGQAFSHTFDEAGTYDYSCSIHPSMKGKVIVQ